MDLTFEMGIAVGLAAGSFIGYLTMYCYAHSRRLADESVRALHCPALIVLKICNNYMYTI